MALHDSHEFHRFCWAEVCTPAKDVAKQFYGTVFGWEFQDLWLPDGMNYYAMVSFAGCKAAGLNELAPEQVEAGITAFWNSDVCVKDVRQSFAKCLELAANVLYEEVDILEIGSMAMLQEPEGASFSLWQPRDHKGMQVTLQLGAACWFELVTNDVSASSHFYGTAFGWMSATDSNQPALTNLSRLEAGEGEKPVGA